MGQKIIQNLPTPILNTPQRLIRRQNANVLNYGDTPQPTMGKHNPI